MEADYSTPLNYEAIFTANCSIDRIPGIFTYEYSFIFKATQQSLVNGDPHFSQLIYDQQSQTTNLICYDIVGKSDQRIQIIEFEKEKIEISGKLLDDYYMHEINLYSNIINMTTTTKGLFVDNIPICSLNGHNSYNEQKIGMYIVQ
ncbi:unnamed protein product [Dimorphilus gyrociliatus]|uniref:Uncharacterized protein n=1 Tax=Dimorphilus gyrociliatus TaxID=2664684 RepID=A0A7I8WDT7_9ANNE|nr:unnamed protein product [Dimorphilus gyrociliatus]